MEQAMHRTTQRTARATAGHVATLMRSAARRRQTAVPRATGAAARAALVSPKGSEPGGPCGRTWRARSAAPPRAAESRL